MKPRDSRQRARTIAKSHAIPEHLQDQPVAHINFCNRSQGRLLRYFNMPSVAMLSQERIQDSSDDESSGSPEVAAQGSKSTSSGAEKKSKTNLSRLNSRANEMLSDESDASEYSSKSSSSSQSAGSKRKAIEPAKTTSNPPPKKPKTE